jgi:hypothetical protein
MLLQRLLTIVGIRPKDFKGRGFVRLVCSFWRVVGSYARHPFARRPIVTNSLVSRFVVGRKACVGIVLRPCRQPNITAPVIETIAVNVISHLKSARGSAKNPPKYFSMQHYGLATAYPYCHASANVDNTALPRFGAPLEQSKVGINGVDSGNVPLAKREINRIWEKIELNGIRIGGMIVHSQCPPKTLAHGSGAHHSARGLFRSLIIAQKSAL